MIEIASLPNPNNTDPENISFAEGVQMRTQSLADDIDFLKLEMSVCGQDDTDKRAGYENGITDLTRQAKAELVALRAVNAHALARMYGAAWFRVDAYEYSRTLPDLIFEVETEQIASTKINPAFKDKLWECFDTVSKAEQTRLKNLAKAITGTTVELSAQPTVSYKEPVKTKGITVDGVAYDNMADFLSRQSAGLEQSPPKLELTGKFIEERRSEGENLLSHFNSAKDKAGVIARSAFRSFKRPRIFSRNSKGIKLAPVVSDQSAA